MIAVARKPTTAIHLRWMIRKDMQEVLAIEAGSFQFPWSEEDFIRALRQRNVIGFIAEQNESVVGFMVYLLEKKRLHLLNIAVHPGYRNQRVGEAMVKRLIGKLSKGSRNRIMLEVRETNLPAQLFFRAMGFRAVSVLRDFYEGTPEDAFLFQYRHKEG